MQHHNNCGDKHVVLKHLHVFMVKVLFWHLPTHEGDKTPDVSFIS